MTLYLILHKVRGEGAFDIATKMAMEDGAVDWWIIPTSGHRAYPYWYEELTAILEDSRGGASFADSYLAQIAANPPADLPDHYAASRREAAVRQPKFVAVRSAEDITNLIDSITSPKPEDL